MLFPGSAKPCSPSPASAVLLTLLGGGPFHGDWNPMAARAIWPFLLCGAQWLLTHYVQDSLRPRELFLSLLDGVSGHALVRAAREAGGEAGESQQSLRKLQNTTVVLEVLAIVPYVLLLGARTIAAAPAPAGIVTVRLLIHAVCGALFIVILHLFAHEQTLSAAGVDAASARGLSRIGGSITGVVGIFLAALVLSWPRALLSLSLLARFFAWLQSIMPRGAPGNAKPPGLDALTQGPDVRELLQQGLPPASESDLLVRIIRVAGIVLAVAAGIALLFFVIRPLLSRDTRRTAAQMHPLRSLLRSLHAILRFIAALPRAITRWMKEPGTGFSSVPRAILGSLRASRQGGSRRQQVAQDRAARRAQDRAVRDFQRLTRWGRRAGVIFNPAEGPVDYVTRLETHAPAKGAALREAVLLFEELVYADAPAEHGVRALARIVDGIVR